MDINTKELYLTICCSPRGEQILIDADGEIHTIEASQSLRGFPEDWLYFGKAEGDFRRSEWGIRWDEEKNGFVADMDGVFDSSEDALRAAVEAFGITAEDHDDLIDRVADLVAQEAAK